MDKSKSSFSHSEIGSFDRLTVRSHHSATVKFYTGEGQFFLLFIDSIPKVSLTML